MIVKPFGDHLIAQGMQSNATIAVSSSCKNIQPYITGAMDVNQDGVIVKRIGGLMTEDVKILCRRLIMENGRSSAHEHGHRRWIDGIQLWRVDSGGRQLDNVDRKALMDCKVHSLLANTSEANKVGRK